MIVKMIYCPYWDERRDIQSNIPLGLKEILRAPLVTIQIQYRVICFAAEQYCVIYCCAVQCSTVEYIAVQCSTVYSVLLQSSLCNILLCSPEGDNELGAPGTVTPQVATSVVAALHCTALYLRHFTTMRFF